MATARESIRPFFKQLGEQCKQIEAVAMDMNTAFDLEVKQHCPQAEVVYDLFHVVARYGREVIDRIRVAQANELKHDKPARKVVKGARWMLLRNKENLSSQQAVRATRVTGCEPTAGHRVCLERCVEEHLVCPEHQGRMATMAGVDAACQRE